VKQILRAVLRAVACPRGKLASRRVLCGCLLLFASIAWGQVNNQTATDYIAKRLVFPLIDAPQSVPSASVSVNGNPGPATYFYWIVSQSLAGASSPAGPFMLSGAPNALSGSNFDQISWQSASNAISYDVLRTTTPFMPAGACNCAVATGITGNSVNDQSNSVNAYTVRELDPSTLQFVITNESSGAAVSRLVFRVNGASIGTWSSTGVFTPISLTGPKINGFFYVDGVTYTTIQQAITAACAATPAGGTVYVPPGTYPQNSQFTLCNDIYLIGAGRSTCDSVTAPTTITTTLTTGDLFNVTSLSHVHISGICVKNIGTGGGVPLHVVGGLFGMYQDLYFSGPWANGIVVSPNVGNNSAIWNTFRNIHHTGYQTGAAMVVLDALNTTSQVINNNRFELMTGQGGATGFGVKLQATGGACPGGNTFINENNFSGGQDSTSLGGGTGVSADNCTFRNLWMDTQTIEANNLSISIGTGNTGFNCQACEISANTTNIPVDNSGATGRTVITGNIGGTPQKFAVAADGTVRLNGIVIGNGTASPGNIVLPSGQQMLPSGTGTIQFDNTDTQFLKPIFFPEGAAPTCSAGNDNLWGDSAAHRLKMCNNNGTPAQVVASGADINTSDQVTATHLAAPLPTAQGGTAQNSTAVFPASGTVAVTSGTMRFYTGCSGTATALATLAMPWPGSALTTCANVSSNIQVPLTTAGTAKNLRVRCGTAGAAAGSGVFTLQQNGANTALTCTVGTGTTCSDTTHTAALSAGDLMLIGFTTQAAETLANCSASFEVQ
jgi:hypothetical protein